MEPAGYMEIGEKSGVPWRTVMAKLGPLKKEGYVESPVEWKYVVTCKGKKAAAWLSFLLIEKNAM